MRHRRPSIRMARKSLTLASAPRYSTPDADIHAVYPLRHQLASRVRAFVDLVALSLSQQATLRHAGLLCGFQQTSAAST